MDQGLMIGAIVGGVACLLGIALAVYGILTADKGVIGSIDMWPKERIPLTFVFETLDSRSMRVLSDAVTFWEEAVPGLVNPLGELTLEGALIPVIFYGSAGHVSEEDEGRLAYTHLVHGSDGRIQSASIQVNATRAGNLDDTTLCRALAHEIGHALGLDHDEVKTSVMWPKASQGEFEVTEGDRALLASLYSLNGLDVV